MWIREPLFSKPTVSCDVFTCNGFARNSMKSNLTLEKIGAQVKQPGGDIL
jgi:hypothetical protein